MLGRLGNWLPDAKTRFAVLLAGQGLGLVGCMFFFFEQMVGCMVALGWAHLGLHVDGRQPGPARPGHSSQPAGVLASGE